ncbi:hypothetical protein ACH5RR_019187 [Cinchona calisaya]|uniref:Cysteine proteinase inhibitor n=1 Tax=Cinchona calisaya TaxID=153742 RepID=A0ABD2ZP72_9GENT
MALRVALNRARPWGCRRGYQLLEKVNLGFLGAIDSSGSVVELNYFRRYPSSNQFCRHYFMPPPPPYMTVDGKCFSGVFRVPNSRVLQLAKFAVKKHNEDQGGSGDDILRLVRVVRAGTELDFDMLYRITLEAVDEKKGELNVYYAEVLDCLSNKTTKLICWKLVDHSFSYPYGEIRRSKRSLMSRKRCNAARKNDIIRDWLNHMSLQFMDEMISRGIIFFEHIVHLDPLKQILDFEKSLLNAEISSGNAIDPLLTVASDVIVPVVDIESYQNIYNYALAAVRTRNTNEDDVIRLEEVLWASKSKIDGVIYYIILLEAMDGKEELNFYLTIIKVRKLVNELIKFLLINPWNPLKTDEVLEGPNKTVGCLKGV